MKQSYYNEVLDLAIKHAGHEILADMVGNETSELSDIKTSGVFDRSISRIISKEKRKQRNSKALRIAAKIAAGFLIVIIISTAVIFSSEALRTEVLNMFINIGEKSADIEFSDIGDVPEAVVLPYYLPAGFTLKESKKEGRYYYTTYENPEGIWIKLNQYPAGTSTKVNSEGIASYVTEIKGCKVYVNEHEVWNTIVFNNDEYVFELKADISISEMLKIVESMLK